MSILDKRLCTFKIANVQFQPGVLPTIATVCLIYAFTSLGFWQLDRASYKENLHDTLEARKSLYPVGLDHTPSEVKDRLFLPVALSGSFDNQHQILLDNRVVNHKVGYNIFTPFLTDDGRWIMVNRGWVQQGRTREDIPDISLDETLIQLTGLLASPPPHGILLQETYIIDEWPAVVQNINMAYLSTRMDRPLYDLVLHMDQASPNALYRDPLPINIDNSRNYGYAFQWFSFSAALLIIYVVVNARRIK